MLQAIPVEAGFSVSGGERMRDSFDEGLRKYRSSIRLYTLNSVSVSTDSFSSGLEAFLRFPDVLAKNHTVGIAVGNKILPEFTVNELRTDGLYETLDWNFNTPYFLITYNYDFGKHPLRFLRRWDFGLGGAFGPILNPEMKIQGYQADVESTEYWTSRQNAHTGFLYRVEGSISRRYFHYMRIRTGLRYDYLYMGGFDGNINGTRGTFFYTQNGGIMPLSLSSYNLLYMLSSDPYQTDSVPLAMIKDRILFTSQSMEVFFAVSVDTR